MIAASVLLSVLLLRASDLACVARPVADVLPADLSEESASPLSDVKKAKHARISSLRAELDRSAGVACFEGDAVVDYGDDCRLRADTIFVFFSKSNGLDRVVASGNVTVSNDTRRGSCESAVFRRKLDQIEMYGDGENRLARLSSGPSDEIAGKVVKFWLGAEQVEVLGSEVKVGRGRAREGRSGL